MDHAAYSVEFNRKGPSSLGGLDRCHNGTIIFRVLGSRPILLDSLISSSVSVWYMIPMSTTCQLCGLGTIKFAAKQISQF